MLHIVLIASSNTSVRTCKLSTADVSEVRGVYIQGIHPMYICKRFS